MHTHLRALSTNSRPCACTELGVRGVRWAEPPVCARVCAWSCVHGCTEHQPHTRDPHECTRGCMQSPSACRTLILHTWVHSGSSFCTRGCTQDPVLHDGCTQDPVLHTWVHSGPRFAHVGALRAPFCTRGCTQNPLLPTWVHSGPRFARMGALNPILHTWVHAHPPARGTRAG